MDHVIKIFVGDSGEWRDSTYYRSSLSGSDIERCHKTACQAIGIAWWGDLRCDTFRLTREEGEALKKVPALAELIEEDKRGSFRVDIAWSDVYLEVARHGASLLGLDLQFEEIEADYIDAGGEILPRAGDAGGQGTGRHVRRFAEGLFWHARMAGFDFGQWFVNAEAQGGLDALPNLSAVLKFAEENGLKTCA